MSYGLNGFLKSSCNSVVIAGNLVTECPHCRLEANISSPWFPQEFGYDMIRYVCGKNFTSEHRDWRGEYVTNDVDSNQGWGNRKNKHHLDIPLCPYCGLAFNLYTLQSSDSNLSKRKHNYCIKCPNSHLLPITNLFCCTRKGKSICGSSYKLQWNYDTMVLRCDAQKNRDHDLWWVKYKGEWKQRRTIIRYKKELLSKLTDIQRQFLLGLVMEGDTVPDPVLTQFFSANPNPNPMMINQLMAAQNQREILYDLCTAQNESNSKSIDNYDQYAYENINWREKDNNLMLCDSNNSSYRVSMDWKSIQNDVGSHYQRICEPKILIPNNIIDQYTIPYEKINYSEDNHDKGDDYSNCIVQGVPYDTSKCKVHMEVIGSFLCSSQ